MILLSIWICALMLLASEKLNNENYYIKFFMFVLFMMMASLFLTFSSLNIFYLFFEISLIPTFILILGWGYQYERIEAGMYVFFYTLFASLPMIVVFYFYYSFNSLIFFT